MRRILRFGFLLCVLCTIAAVSCYADDEAGIYNLTPASNVTIQVLDEDKNVCEPDSQTFTNYVNGVLVPEPVSIYFGDVALEVQFTGSPKKVYIVKVVLDDDGTTDVSPVDSEIARAGSDGSASATLHPVLTYGKAYKIVLQNGTVLAKFVYDVPHTVGDLTGDGRITTNDVLYTLWLSVGRIEETETLWSIANVNHDAYVNSGDALLTLWMSTGAKTISYYATITPSLT